MEVLRVKIFITRVEIYLFKKSNFLPQKIRDKIAKMLLNNIRIITNDMKYREII